MSLTLWNQISLIKHWKNKHTKMSLFFIVIVDFSFLSLIYSCGLLSVSFSLTKKWKWTPYIYLLHRIIVYFFHFFKALHFLTWQWGKSNGYDLFSMSNFVGRHNSKKTYSNKFICFVLKFLKQIYQYKVLNVRGVKELFYVFSRTFNSFESIFICLVNRGNLYLRTRVLNIKATYGG